MITSHNFLNRHNMMSQSCGFNYVLEIKQLKYEISTVYAVKLQRYGDQKIGFVFIAHLLSPLLQNNTISSLAKSNLRRVQLLNNKLNMYVYANLISFNKCRWREYTYTYIDLSLYIVPCFSERLNMRSMFKNYYTDKESATLAQNYKKVTKNLSNTINQ